jgi:hypothetical protein
VVAGHAAANRPNVASRPPDLARWPGASRRAGQMSRAGHRTSRGGRVPRGEPAKCREPAAPRRAVAARTTRRRNPRRDRGQPATRSSSLSWCAKQGSNPRPSPCKGTALPAELFARGASGRRRTDDLPVTRGLLCHLSYVRHESDLSESNRPFRGGSPAPNHLGQDRVATLGFEPRLSGLWAQRGRPDSPTPQWSVSGSNRYHRACKAQRRTHRPPRKSVEVSDSNRSGRGHNPPGSPSSLTPIEAPIEDGVERRCSKRSMLILRSTARPTRSMRRP